MCRAGLVHRPQPKKRADRSDRHSIYPIAIGRDGFRLQYRGTSAQAAGAAVDARGPVWSIHSSAVYSRDPTPVVWLDVLILI